MNREIITLDETLYPQELKPYLSGAKLYDSSCSAEARVLFIDKYGGFFLKSAPKGALEREAAMTGYFNGKGLAPSVVAYISGEQDFLLTEKLPGRDCTAEEYLNQPERLCDTLAERLATLHGTDFTDCPVPNHTERYLAKARRNKDLGNYDASLFPDNWGYATPEEAWDVVRNYGQSLKTDSLLHGDYCLPNIILDDWSFSGFIDLDGGGVGDRHVDVFWGIWSLGYNLKTNKYRQRFIDAYGRNRVDEEMLRIVAAVEVFG